MANRKPGPLCGSQLGLNWIDAGTMYRTRSSAPGPEGRGDLNATPVGSSGGRKRAVGSISSLVGGATPPSKKRGRTQRLVWQHQIDVLGESPFAKTPEGKRVMAILGRYNSHVGSYKDGIAYANTGAARGSYFRTGIEVSERYSGHDFETVLELVHEASHRDYANHHPTPKPDLKNLEQIRLQQPGPFVLSNKTMDVVRHSTASELYSVLNQIQVYRWLKTLDGDFRDESMELRLKWQADGTLEDKIMDDEIDRVVGRTD